MAQNNPLLAGVDSRVVRRRRLDQLATWLVRVCGALVIAVVGLILVILLAQVAPLLEVPSAQREGQGDLPASPMGLSHSMGSHILIGERNDAFAIFSPDNRVVRFFDVQGGQGARSLEESATKSVLLPFPDGYEPVRYFSSSEPFEILAVDALGAVRGVRATFVQDFADGALADYHDADTYLEMEALWDGASLDSGAGTALVTQLSMGGRGNRATLAVVAGSGVHVTSLKRKTGLDASGWRVLGQVAHPVDTPVRALEVQASGGVIYVDAQGRLRQLQTPSADTDEPEDILDASWGTMKVQTLASILGHKSFVAGSEAGELMLFTRNSEGELEMARHFDSMPATITQIIPEGRRKGFLALDATGNLGGYYMTSTKRAYLLENAVAEHSGQEDDRVFAALSPRLNSLLLAQSERWSWFGLDNEYPEADGQLIWGQVRYEGYDEADWIWQSSSADTDSEPKFSLVPLVVGTLKGAFYALLFAVPLALLGAMYTAKFMHPKARQIVKPMIELMAALPTVILGFLGGLWLAPLVEDRLLGVFFAPVLAVLGLVALGYGTRVLPNSIKDRIAGWEFLVGAPIVVLSFWGALYGLGPALEAQFFGDSLPAWMDENLNQPYEQRNALIVGIAMGFAVVPTIFSIAEDAIFEVPKGLVEGSMALGATAWQTAVWVVLPTASPGIFAALVMGLGRAVGETMIVVMATGNTPIVDWSIFNGMRTLSAGIAVEMPEAEVGSTHFRILYLSALILLCMTFVLNSVAELVRERLRHKYAKL